MKNLASSLVALFATTILATPATAQRPVTPAEMREDLFQLSELLESQHPGLLRYQTRDELDEAFGEALLWIEEERDLLAFYRVVAELVSDVRCGHTETWLRSRDWRAVEKRRGLLPYEVFLSGDRLFVRRALDDSLAPGTEIEAIDGRSVQEIRRIAFSRLSGDGFIETGRERELEGDFARYYARLVQEEDEGPFLVRVAGESEARSVTGLLPGEFDQRETDSATPPLIALEVREADDLAVLAIESFEDRRKSRFLPQLEAAFRRVNELGIGNLVLDLRGNGGGDDIYGAFLVSCFSPEPFHYFDRIEVTKSYRGEGGIVERDGMRLVTEHEALALLQPAPDRFGGRAFVLTDGRTFSTAADVATVLHHLGLAEGVGEETGGGYDGNTSGFSKTIKLARTGIRVEIPQWCYVTANLGHDYYGRGVPPHHPTHRTIEDVLAARDVELERVLELIGARAASPGDGTARPATSGGNERD